MGLENKALSNRRRNEVTLSANASSKSNDAHKLEVREFVKVSDKIRQKFFVSLEKMQNTGGVFVDF